MSKELREAVNNLVEHWRNTPIGIKISPKTWTVEVQPDHEYEELAEWFPMLGFYIDKVEKLSREPLTNYLSGLIGEE